MGIKPLQTKAENCISQRNMQYVCDLIYMCFSSVTDQNQGHFLSSELMSEP